MKTQLLTMSRFAQALLLAGLVAAAAPASAAVYYLRAEALTIWMPSGASVQMPGDTASVPMWGYALCGTGITEPATCAGSSRRVARVKSWPGWKDSPEKNPVPS